MSSGRRGRRDGGGGGGKCAPSLVVVVSNTIEFWKALGHWRVGPALQAFLGTAPNDRSRRRSMPISTGICPDVRSVLPPDITLAVLSDDSFFPSSGSLLPRFTVFRGVPPPPAFLAGRAPSAGLPVKVGGGGVVALRDAPRRCKVLHFSSPVAAVPGGAVLSQAPHPRVADLFSLILLIRSGSCLKRSPSVAAQRPLS